MKKLCMGSLYRRKLRKTLIKMKLTVAFFLAFGIVSMASTGYSQDTRLNISLKNASLQQMISEIEQQSDFSFFYKNDQINVNKRITLKEKDVPISDVLDQALAGTDLTYSVVDKIIVIRPKELTQALKTVTGTVTSENGEPLPGVTVVVKGTQKGTISGPDGKYSLDVPDNAVLVFSFVGFETQEIPVADKTVIDIVLKEEAIGLQEVIAVGYGTQKKINLTGAVASVKSTELAEAPAANTTQLLTGRVAGLITKQNTGIPGGDDPVISIRGFGNPLVLVDGIQMDFSRIDPNEIESISVLKDASAAIYGSRAGNGVILVTTKRGDIGKSVIKYNGTFNFQQPTVLPEWVGAAKWSELLREAELNDGLPPTFSEEDVAKYKEGTDPAYQSYDWIGTVTKKWTPMQQHNLSVNGGTKKIRYFTSLGMTNQSSMYRSNDLNYKRVNMRTNVDFNVTKNLSFATDIYYRNQFIEGTPNSTSSIWNSLRTAKPIYPVILPDPTRAAYSGFLQRSPYAETMQSFAGFTNNYYNFISGRIELKYKLPWISGLDVSGVFNFFYKDIYTKRMQKEFPIWEYDMNSETYIQQGVNGRNYLTESVSRSRQLLPRLKINYSNTFNNVHTIKALLVGELIDDRGSYLSAERKDLLSYEVPYMFAGSEENKDNYSSGSQGGRASLAGRVNYDFKGKYLAEATFRYDASSKYPEDTRWGFFPGVSLGWRISEESFIKDHTSAIDNLKLRLSYGQIGNDRAGGQYEYLTGYVIMPNSMYIFGNTLGTSIRSTGLANPDITWETMTIYNAGMDVALWKRLVGMEVDVFYRKRAGILAYPVKSFPSTFGAPLPMQNLNSQDDRGFELVLTHYNKIGDFTYSVRGNFSYARSKWIHYEESEYTDPDEIRIYKKSGKWTNRWIGYVSNGIFMSQDEIDNLTVDQDQHGNTTLRPGDIRYVDLNNDSIIDWHDQKIIGYGPDPDIIFGLTLNVEYKGIYVNALFQGASMFNMLLTGAARAPFSNESIPLEYHYKYRWTPNPDNPGENINPNAKLPAVSTSGAGNNNNKVSDFWLQDNTYLRLKSLNVGYSLPAKWISPIGLKQLNIYLSGTNLLTFSKLGIYKKSFDPEGPRYQDTRIYPPVKTVTFGVNITL